MNMHGEVLMLMVGRGCGCECGWWGVDDGMWMLMVVCGCVR